MLRRLFTLLSAVSLLLCVAMVPLWFRSFWHQDRLSAALRGEEFHAVTARGSLTFLWHSNLELTEPGLHVNSLPVPGDSLPPDYLWSVWLFSKGHEITDTDDGPITYRHIVVPSWVAALVFAVLPVTWLVRLRRRRRRIRLDLCTSCGYDLRATPGRCPECGRAAGVVGKGKREDAKDAATL